MFGGPKGDETVLTGGFRPLSVVRTGAFPELSDSFLTEFSEVQPSPVPNAPGSGMGVLTPRRKLMFCRESASTIPHIYPSVLQALPGRGYAGCLEG